MTTQPSPIPDLPPTAWAVLGQLSFGDELSGYDVKRWADQSIAFFYWAPSQSQIYSELRRLEGLGLATSAVEQTHEARSRRLYAITELGQQSLEAWMRADEVDPLVLKHPLLLKIWAAHNGGAAQLRPQIEEHRERALARAAKAREHAANATKVPEWKFPVISLEWSERFYLDEASRLEWLLQRLDQAE